MRLRGHELLGQNPSLLRSELNPPGHFTDLCGTPSPQGSVVGEICNCAKDGSLYWVEVTVVPIRDAAGEIALLREHQLRHPVPSADALR